MDITIKNQIENYLQIRQTYENPHINYLDFDVSTRRALRRAGITFLGDFVGKKLDSIKRFTGLTVKAFEEVLQTLALYGFDTSTGVVTGEVTREQPLPEDIATYKMDMSDGLFRYLNKNEIRSLNAIVKTCHKQYMPDKNFEELKRVMVKYGYTVNKTGYFVKPYNLEGNPLFEELKIEGLSVLNICEARYFKKGSVSMQKINRCVEGYLNWLVKQKSINMPKEEFAKVEKEVDALREKYKEFVENQREIAEQEDAQAVFNVKMAGKNRELRSFHHYDFPAELAEGHDYNSFADFEGKVF